MRSPFDPLPYSGLIDACERFFEFIVAVRQSSLFYHPRFVRDNSEAAARLLAYRRDAIAAVLTNLYVLSGALRAGRKVPVSHSHWRLDICRRGTVTDSPVEVLAECGNLQARAA